MGTGRTDYKIVMFVFAGGLISSLAQAEPAAPALAPLNIKAKYDVAWSGIKIGRIYIESSEDANGYRMSVDTKTSGIAQLFSDEQRVAKVEGHGGLGQPYVPVRYESYPTKDKKDQKVLIRYDTTGRIDSLQRIPSDDPKWRPLVPADQANTATDPITAGFILREKLYGAAVPQATVRTYDAARLAEMTFKIVEPHARLTIRDKPIMAVNTVVTRKPITGYTPKELKKFAKGDPEIHLYFSDDAAFLPVRATIDSGFGQITATLVSQN